MREFFEKKRQDQPQKRVLPWLGLVVIGLICGSISSQASLFNVMSFLKTQWVNTPYKRITGGAGDSGANSHTCGLTFQGQLKCWGWNSSGQLGLGTVGVGVSSPTAIGTPSFVSVAGGYRHTCGITANRTLRCWGSDSYGQVGNGSLTTADQASPVAIDSLTPYGTVAAGGYHTCGITQAGDLKCWGWNSSGQLGNGNPASDEASPFGIDSGTSYIEITAGYAHTCGITGAGVLKCWGLNSSGQVGNGVVGGSSTSPVEIDSGTPYIAVSAGDAHTCGITGAGVLKCWGSDSNGKLGNGTLTSADQPSPVVIDSGTTYLAVSAGVEHTCGITGSGVLKCWGSDANGQLGNGSTSGNQFSPVATNSGANYVGIWSGRNHTCAITSRGVLECWGSDASGQLGNGSTLTSDVLSPASIDKDRFQKGIYQKTATSGAFTSCGVMNSGVLRCWGSDAFSQLGNGGTGNQTIPRITNSGEIYRQVSVGGYESNSSHACGITGSNQLKCWGSNTSGQVGIGNTAGPVTTPQLVNDPGTRYRKVSLGCSHTCGITTAGQLKCWGYNGFRELGGRTGDLTSPGVVDSGSTYRDVGMGCGFGCGITTRGELKCWGQNTSGQVGNGTSGSSQSTPVVIDSGMTYRAISGGYNFACGIAASGTLKCWGSDNAGQVGNGATTGNQLTPQPVNDPGTVYSVIASGFYYACGITGVGALKCWGSDSAGQLGNGAAVSQDSPMLSDSGTLYTEVGSALGSANWGHSCGITVGGILRCWGRNNSGQLGIGNTANQTSPVDVVR
ncbi:MAG: RCC1 domain-containing protein [Bdellovibrionia bacterium]